MGACDKPPTGWRCTRDAGHDGPCAAVPVPGAWPIAENKEQLEALNMQEIRDMEKMAARQQLESADELKRRAETEQKLRDLEAKLKLEQARVAPMPPITITEEQAKAAGLEVPARTCATCAPTRTDTHYAAVGKVRWALKSQLAELQAKRFVFGADAERRDISIAITHIEDALFRLDRVIDNGAQQ